MRISGFDDLAEAFDKLSQQFEEVEDDWDAAVGVGLKRTARAVRDDAQVRAPVKSGDLEESIGMRRERLFKWYVGSDEPHAPHIEYGRGPVVATDADALKFTIGGGTFYRKSVGPAAAQPYLRPALRDNASELERNIVRAINALLDSVF